MRLAINDVESVAFPVGVAGERFEFLLNKHFVQDTIGYSAPTGYVSSFGVRLTKVNRLPAPYGRCVREEAAPPHIYANYRYSLEARQAACGVKSVLVAAVAAFRVAIERAFKRRLFASVAAAILGL